MSHLIINIILQAIIGAFFWSFLNAYILQLATKWQLDFKPSYFSAYKIAFFSIISMTIIGTLIGYLIGVASPPTEVEQKQYLLQAKASAASLVIGVIIQILIYSKYIAHKEKGAVGINNGAKILANQALIYLFITCVAFGTYALYDKAAPYFK